MVDLIRVEWIESRSFSRRTEETLALERTMAGGQLIWTDSPPLSTTGSVEDATDGGYLVTRDWKET